MPVLVDPGFLKHGCFFGVHHLAAELIQALLGPRCLCLDVRGPAHQVVIGLPFAGERLMKLIGGSVDLGQQQLVCLLVGGAKAFGVDDQSGRLFALHARELLVQGVLLGILPGVLGL